MIISTPQSDAISTARKRPDVFGATNCYIKTKSGGDLILFKPNNVQRVLDAYHIFCQENKIQFRVVILKARQFGVSTWGLQKQYARINFKANHDTVFAAHDDLVTTDLFERVRVMHDKNPEKYATKYSSKRELKLDALNSCMSIQTMGKGELGRSGVFNDVHLSELAFSDQSDAVVRSIAATLPKPHENHDVMYTVESTANGQGGTFYDIWGQCTPLFNKHYITLPRSETQKVGIFFPWHFYPMNAMKAQYGFKESLTGFECDVYGHEKEIMDVYELTLDQMAWRRWSIDNDYKKVLDDFTQENPASDAEAFLSTGRPVFAKNGLTWQRKHQLSPKYKCTIGEYEEINKSPQGMIEIFEEPQRGALYVMGYDPAEGLDKEEKNDPDASSAHVIRVDTKKVVARVNTQADLSVACGQIHQLGMRYNKAWFAFEINNTMGGAARELFKNSQYPNLYFREEVSKISSEMTEVVGWKTDISSRGTMITDMQTIIRERGLLVHSRDTLTQMDFFAFNKNGKAEAKSGQHDDDCMSLAITIQLLLKALATGRVSVMASKDNTYVPEYEGEKEDYAQTLSINGAVDMAYDLEEDDDDDGYYESIGDF